VEVAKMAVQTGLWPLYEMENGEVTKVRKIGKQKKPVEDYLKMQKRFKHLFKMEGGEEQLKLIQALADKNIEDFGLE
jgi:pyruvate ferredoxin oxidoreductase beta subunit